MASIGAGEVKALAVDILVDPLVEPGDLLSHP